MKSPEEKEAQRIINMFYKIETEQPFYIMSENQCKKAALIVVNELIMAYSKMNQSKFYEEVKQIIKEM